MGLLMLILPRSGCSFVVSIFVIRFSSLSVVWTPDPGRSDMHLRRSQLKKRPIGTVVPNAIVVATEEVAMDRVTRCLQCGKRMVPAPSYSGRPN